MAFGADKTAAIVSIAPLAYPDAKSQRVGPTTRPTP
jgi:hypothetical protein